MAFGAFFQLYATPLPMHMRPLKRNKAGLWRPRRHRWVIGKIGWRNHSHPD
jgi:hypothetical protein